MGRFRTWLGAPVDGASLGALRVMFGALMAVSIMRLWARGWVGSIWLDPPFHFTYPGFQWVGPLPGWAMHVELGVLVIAGVLVAVGLWARLMAAVFAVLFTHLELIEKAAYLNHYYLFGLLALLLAVTPSDRALAWRPSGRSRHPDRPSTVPRWALWLVRVQVALVYTYAGVAKLGPDWLLEAQPLQTWLAAYAEVPVIGGLLAAPATAYLLSWGGAAFDLTIAGFLLWPRTRTVAYAAVVVFHVTVWALFPIGLFSWVMIGAATILLSPDWPGRLFRLPAAMTVHNEPPSRPVLVMAAVYLAVQVLVPLRFLLYSGPVNWHEAGFRFAWRVMLTDKAGHVEYRVRAGDGPVRVVQPALELTPLQYRAMSTQPDMVHDYARHLRERLERAGEPNVAVFADAFVAYDGRPSQRYIDPDVELGSREREWGSPSWVLPLRDQNGNGQITTPEPGAAIRSR